MRYSIEDYDSEGFLKAPKWLWCGWLFLAKAWIVFIVAGASRNIGAELLEIIYPVRVSLYMGLIAGLPAICLMWLIGLRTTERKRVCAVLSYGKTITAVTIYGQLALVFYQISMTNLVFNWANALTLLFLVWLMIYVLKSRRVKDCFRSPLLT